MIFAERSLWIGIGFQQAATVADLQTAIAQACGQLSISRAAIAGLASLEHKLPSLTAIAQPFHWELRGFSAAELAAIAVPHPCSRVAEQMQTASVAEAAALAAIQPQAGILLLPKQVFHLNQTAITLAIVAPVPVQPGASIPSGL
ncbi:cobalamin biosynthesis protein [Synechococcus elongatus]|uniref:cobalamin biosynthesis protein n=1 Tax=Synechococcus elongatus TaxID=32046 RepID=UPI000F7F6FB9|nr:cobalamin biosynthesis protein [Synechococcus elongatus]